MLVAKDHTKRFTIEECGLKLCESMPFIGASADGLFNCQCHQKNFTLEIKCPYSLRESETLEGVLTNNKFFLNPDKSLKNNHKYYTRVQLQMYVYNVEQCYFIVLTPKWMCYTLVCYNNAFTSTMLKKLNEFFFKKHHP